MLLAGIASHATIDAERMLVAPGALCWDPNDLPPLLLKHGANAGEILGLRYDRLSLDLRIECRADDLDAARMPGFSVAFTPESFELVDRGGAQFHFRITRARLDEISLTDVPACAGARVERRCLASPLIAGPYRKVANELARMRLTLAG